MLRKVLELIVTQDWVVTQIIRLPPCDAGTWEDRSRINSPSEGCTVLYVIETGATSVFDRRGPLAYL